MKRTRVWTVTINQIWKAEEEPKDIKSIYFEVIAQSVEDAMIKAWSALKLSAQDYEIVSVRAKNMAYYRGDDPGV